MIDQHKKSILYIVLSAILLSTGGVLLKFVNLEPMQIAGARAIISSIVVLIYVKKPKFTFSKAQLSGAFSYSFMVIGFIAANKLTNAANAIVLQYTAPIWVAILSHFILKEKIHNYDILSIIFITIGMGLVFMDDIGGGNIKGDILAIISGVFLAIVTVSLRFQKDESPVETTLLGHIITAIIGIFFLRGIEFTIYDIIGILALGIFQLGISYILYSEAIKHVDAIEASVLMFIEPILNPIWVFLAFGELPGRLALFGCFIVLISILLRAIVSSKRKTIKGVK
ncbi:MAG: EamA family transporter [Tissierellales bacterium]|nr:EamA family transporter [Tissierellales bacterium]